MALRQTRPRPPPVHDALLVIANLAFALYPLLCGWFIDAIQRDPGQVPQVALVYGGADVGVKRLEWCFHGPARILERKLSFKQKPQLS